MFMFWDFLSVAVELRNHLFCLQISQFTLQTLVRRFSNQPQQIVIRKYGTYVGNSGTYKNTQIHFDVLHPEELS